MLHRCHRYRWQHLLRRDYDSKTAVIDVSVAISWRSSAAIYVSSTSTLSNTHPNHNACLKRQYEYTQPSVLQLSRCTFDYQVISSTLPTQQSIHTRRFAATSRGGSRRYQDPSMRVCQSIEELTQLAYKHKDTMSPRGMSAYWAKLSKLLRQRSNNRPSNQMQIQIDELIGQTLRSCETYNSRDLATIAISLAKIMDKVRKSNRTQHKGSPPHHILQEVLIGKDLKNKEYIFNYIASASVPILHEFNARDVSNFIYAFGLVEEVVLVENGSTFFDMLAEEVLSFDNLDEFLPQHLSNIVWAYATAGEQHPQLFKKVADHFVGLDNLNFNGQDCSNTVWAYATLNEQHPKLFEKVGDHIVSLDSLDEFWSQALSNIVLAFAKAGESHPQLFKKLANEAIKRQHEEQHIANFLWAYATNGQVDEHLFSSLVPSVKANLDEYTAQGLSNVAWAYSVANVNVPSVFNEEFINACLEKKDEFVPEALTQLHQWQLWQDEIKSDVSLPSPLQKKCYEAFISRVPEPSKLQDNVVSSLSSMDLQPQEEVLLKSGYRIDAVVEVNEKQIAIEVDGPYHFIGRSRERLGSTILKHRQVASVDEMRVVSIPYWEWDKLNKDDEKKQKYLQQLLMKNV